MSNYTTRKTLAEGIGSLIVFDPSTMGVQRAL